MYIDTDADPILTIIGIDPGTNLLGLAILRFDSRTDKIVSTEAYTISVANSIRFPGSYLDKQCLDYVERTEIIRIGIKRRLTLTHNVLSIVAESGFFNQKSPNAFKVLAVHLHIVSSFLRNLYPFSEYLEFAPMTVKAAIGAKKMKGKDAVREAILLNKEIMGVFKSDAEALTEHSIDALGVAYTRYSKLLYRKSTRK